MPTVPYADPELEAIRQRALTDPSVTTPRLAGVPPPRQFAEPTDPLQNIGRAMSGEGDTLLTGGAVSRKWGAPTGVFSTGHELMSQ